MKYLLDTDIVSYALRGYGRVGEHISRMEPNDIGISSITLAELSLGSELNDSQKIRRAINAFIRSVNIAPFDEPAAFEFGRIGSLLSNAGSPIGEFDALIAAHAVSLDCVLVTNNERHFTRVPWLKVENWT